MSKTVRIKAADGSDVEFVVKSDPPSGAMKYVYFAPDKSYVVAFFKDKQDARSKSRLSSITDKYRRDIFDQVGGSYWNDLFCWPQKMVEYEGTTGIVVPAYNKKFYFQHDRNLRGREKEGKWFASAKLLRNLDPVERGTFLSYLQISLKIARAVRRMHAAGLAHSDLSYKNVLIDPAGGNACIIDIDGLVVPGKFPPDVLGTPDFIAPEVLCSQDSPNPVLPSQATDKHALAVLIYMYLLHRHPLRGGRFFGPDVETEEEEMMLMGSSPLYIEHPTNAANRNMKREYGKDLSRYLPWVDLVKFSAANICGPFIAKLFERAFIDGLANPMRRPIADEWENAILKTTDRLQPCSNPRCEQKWFVFDGSRKPQCPFCGTAYQGTLPVLHFYSHRPGGDTFVSENYQLMVFHGQSLNNWHVYRHITPNEKLQDKDKGRVAYFLFHQNQWLLVNEKMPALYEIGADGTKTPIPPGKFVVLEENRRILLSPETGGRLVLVQMAGI